MPYQDRYKPRHRKKDSSLKAKVKRMALAAAVMIPVIAGNLEATVNVANFIIGAVDHISEADEVR